jgi:hypothetical protein
VLCKVHETTTAVQGHSGVHDVVPDTRTLFLDQLQRLVEGERSFDAHVRHHAGPVPVRSRDGTDARLFRPRESISSLIVQRSSAKRYGSAIDLCSASQILQPSIQPFEVFANIGPRGIGDRGCQRAI